MAVVATGLTSDKSTALTATKTTASVTLTAQNLILLAVATRITSGGPVTVSSVTSTGATWELVSSGTYNTNESRLEVWRTMVNPGQTGVITINLSAACNRCVWSVTKFENVPVTGSNGADAIIQAVEQAILFPGPPFGEDFVQMAAFADAGNATYGVVSLPLTGTNPGSGWTEIHDVLASPGTIVEIETEFKNSNDLTVNWGFSGSATAVGMGFEIGFATGTNTAQALAATSTFTAAISKSYGKILAVDTIMSPGIQKGIGKALSVASTFAQGFSLASEQIPGQTDVSLAASSVFAPDMVAEKRGIHGNYEGSIRLKTNYRGLTRAG